MVGGVAALLLVIAAVLLPARGSQAAVTASVDRADIEINESLTLRIELDTHTDVEPDVSALEADFDVGEASRLTDMSIINGRMSRRTAWNYVLRPKRVGDLVIPAIEVGNEESNPLRITVAPQSKAPPGEADVFVTAEVDHEESYVQAQILYTVKVYRAVATRQPRLSGPDFDGIEVLVELAGDERGYDSELNGKSYNVAERVYALFPQESGELSIAPAQFEARVWRGGTITGRKVFESEPLTVVVKPIPAPPAEYPDAAWLPAKSVQLSEEWSREPESLPAGEPITRHVTITASGQLSTQIPVIEPAESDGVKIYPDKPELRVSAEPDGIRAVRKDQYAMIGVQPGVVELPPLELPWWDIEERKWQVARLPSRRLTILPSRDPARPAAVTQASEARARPEAIEVGGGFWRRVSEGLIALWLLTVIAWWWSRRPDRERKEPAPPPIYKQQAKFLKAARRAALAGDDASLKAALLSWGRLQWPHDRPRSIGELAARVSDPLKTELESLCAANYGPDETSWNGETLAKALRSFSVKSADEARESTDDLPPLMPGTPVQ